MNRRQKKKLQKRFVKSWEIYIQEGQAYHALITMDTYSKSYRLISAYGIAKLNPIAYNPPKIGVIWVSLPLPKFFTTLKPWQFKKLPASNHYDMFEALGVDHEPLSDKELEAAGYITDIMTSLNMVNEWVESIKTSYTGRGFIGENSIGE